MMEHNNAQPMKEGERFCYHVWRFTMPAFFTKINGKGAKAVLVLPFIQCMAHRQAGATGFLTNQPQGRIFASFAQNEKMNDQYAAGGGKPKKFSMKRGGQGSQIT